MSINRAMAAVREIDQPARHSKIAAKPLVDLLVHGQGLAGVPPDDHLDLIFLRRVDWEVLGRHFWCFEPKLAVADIIVFSSQHRYIDLPSDNSVDIMSCS